MTLLAQSPPVTEELAIVGSYPEMRGLRLHSLRAPLPYLCAHCGDPKETVIIALTEQAAPVCPACFAHRMGEPID